MSDFAVTRPARMRLPGDLGSWAAALPGHVRLVLSFLCGASFALAQAPFGLLPLLILAFSGLFILLHGAEAAAKPLRAGFLTAWAFGFGASALGMYWVAFAFLVQAEEFAWMIPILVPGLMALLAVFFGLSGLITVLLWRRRRFGGGPLARSLLFAVAFSIGEYLRGTVLTGLPWNLTAQAAIGFLPLAQAARLLGPYGLGLLLVLLSALPGAFLLRGSGSGSGSGSGRASLLLFAGGLGALLAFGAFRLSAPPPEAPRAQVLLVQPSVPQRDKLDAAKRAEHLFRMLELTEAAARAAPASGGPIYAAWPENAFPFLDSQPGVEEGLATRLPGDTLLVSGSVRAWDGPDGELLYGNSVTVFGATEEGRKPLLALYDKHHLVPFGEYLPAAGLIEALGLASLSPVGAGGFTPGAGPAVLDIGPAAFSPLICYEGIFPGQLYPEDARPDWLLTVTNDAWFGDGAGPKQHLAIARLRAIETGLPMARAANTGISALIDAEGRLLEALPLYEPGTILAPLPGARPPTLYDRLGKWSYLFLLLLLVTIAHLRVLRRC